MVTLLTPSSKSCPPRWATPRTARPTLGPRVAQVGGMLGTPFMPWQRLVADTALEVNPDTGRLVYREIRLLVPRQCGKTTLMLATMVHRALGFGGQQRIVYTAQTRNDAREKWEDEHVITLERSRLKPKFRVRKTNGNEAIIWANGSTHKIAATTEKAGHGKSLDLAVVDEAFSHSDNRLEQGFKPPMVTRPEPQLWVVSTAGDERSLYLADKVKSGRRLAEDGVTSGVCYVEFSADEDADPADPATWRSCMPALGHTITEDTIAAEFAGMDLADFQRAYLNQWVAKSVGDPLIPAETWSALGDPEFHIESPPVFAIDMPPERKSVTIGVAGWLADGVRGVGLADRRPGTSWVAERAKELQDRHHAVIVLDARSPAASLLPDLQAAGVEVELVNGAQMAQACGFFMNAIDEATAALEADGSARVGLRHDGQPKLAEAVAAGQKRRLGEAWAWRRRDVEADIAPLVAVTLAHWAHTQFGVRESYDVLASVY